MSTPILAWSLLAVPLGAGTVLATTGRRGDRVAAPAGILTAAVTLLLGVTAAWARPSATAPLFAGMAAQLKVDGLSAVLVLTVTAITLAVLVFSAGEFSREPGSARYFGLMLLFAGAMLVTVTAATLPLLLMGWEVMGATSYGLIGFWWREPERVRAANVAFLTTRAGDLGLYVAAGAALAGGVGSLALNSLPRAGTPWLAVLTVGLLLAVFGKSAQLPFSFWLSRAMAGPSPVSALLHSATMVAAGAYLLLRLQPLLAATGWAGPLVAWVGALTALGLGLVALAQSDLKQLLAASTCAQIGFMVLAAGAGGLAAGTQQLVAHAATKSLLFLAAGAWLTALGTKQLPALRGAARDYPLVGAAFTIGVLSLAGVPPLAIWVSKDEVLTAALHRSPALYAAGLLAAAGSALYSAKAAWYLWQPAPPDAAAGYDREGTGTRRVPPVAGPPLVALAAGAATLGGLGWPPAAAALRRVLEVPGEPSSTGRQLAFTGALALLAAAAAWWSAAARQPFPGPLHRWFAGWLGLEPAVQRLLVGPTLAGARALASFDDRVVDGTVRALATGAVRLARAGARFDDSQVDGAVGRLAAAARGLGRLSRRPQTGLVHQYYAQAAAGLVVLALVLVLVR